MIRRLWVNAFASPYLRGFGLLTGGTFLSQLIPLFMLGVYTRIFSAEAFGMLTLLQAAVPLFVPLATGYFDVAILLPKQAWRAKALVSFAIVIACGVTVFALLVLALIKQPFLAALNAEAMGNWVYAYPAVIFCSAILSIASYWLLRQRRYGLQSALKLVLTASTALITFFCGMLGSRDGLLIGMLCGLLLAAGWGTWVMARTGFPLTMRYVRVHHMKSLGRKYRNFPLYGSIPTAMSCLAQQFPLLIITATYSLAIASHYAVVRNILFAGVSLIALCIGQVFINYLMPRVHRNERIWPATRQLALAVSAIALCTSAAIYLIGPWFFPIFLGPGWEDTAHSTRTLAFATFFWMVAPTFSAVAVALERIRAVALWQGIYCLTCPALLIARTLPFDTFIAWYTVFETAAYALYAAWMLYVIRKWDNQPHPPTKRSPTVLPYAAV